MRRLGRTALCTTLFLAACSPPPPAAARRIVYEVAPERAAEVAEVLQARLGPSITVRAGEAGRLFVEIGAQDDEARIRRLAEKPGRLRFLIAAEPGDGSPGGWRQDFDRLASWRHAHPELPWRDAPAPAAGATWTARAGVSEEAEIEERAVPLLEPTRAEWRFDAPPLTKIELGQDDFGYPAIWLELGPERRAAFAEFTAAHVGRRLAVVLDEEAIVVATINAPLPASFQLTGGPHGFSDEQLALYVPVLRHGMLPAPVKYVETRALR